MNQAYSTQSKKSQILSVVILFLILVTCYFAYLPGVTSGFLFDDIPNLSPLGKHGSIQDWQTAHAFISSGFSGPTGRPLSLASFLLDDNTWPSHAPWFKLTNIIIHILCGLLLCWAVLLLVRNCKSVSEQQAQWIAVLTCAFWVLHPYMVSTTLYVVQRMAQLATLFSLAGIVLYLHARLSLNKTPKLAYFWMTFAIALFTALATLSKENGALLPLLILCIEFCLPKSEKPAWQWRAVFLWLPSIAIAVLMARYVTFADNPWPNRNFNMIERLLTEARIICEYLLHLFVPRIEGNGLYQDGYVISRSLWRPVTTVPAIVFLAGLLGFAFWARRKAPMISLAILFFFAAHLMESTVVGLELYFEHRNYQAALFLFLPLAWYCVILTRRFKLLPVIAMAVLLILTSMTWLRTSLWGDNLRLQNYWAVSASDSPRAQSWLAIQIFEQGRINEGLDFLEQAQQNLPDSSLLTMQWLLQRVIYGLANEADFDKTAGLLLSQRFDAQTLSGMKVLTSHLIQNDKSSEYRNSMLKLIQNIDKHPQFQKSSVYRRFSPYFKGLLLVSEQNITEAMPELSKAMNLHTDPDVGFSMIAHLGRNGHPVEGLELLEKMKSKYANKTTSLTTTNFNTAELDSLEQALKEDIALINKKKFN